MTRGADEHIIGRTVARRLALLLVIFKIAVIVISVMAAPWVIGATDLEP